MRTHCKSSLPNRRTFGARTPVLCFVSNHVTDHSAILFVPHSIITHIPPQSHVYNSLHTLNGFLCAAIIAITTQQSAHRQPPSTRHTCFTALEQDRSASAQSFHSQAQTQIHTDLYTHTLRHEPIQHIHTHYKT